MSLPPSLAPTAFQLDVVGALKQNLIAIIFIFFFLDLFDSVGSLIGIAKQAGFMKEGKLPRAGRAAPCRCNWDGGFGFGGEYHDG